MDNGVNVAAYYRVEFWHQDRLLVAYPLAPVPGRGDMLVIADQRYTVDARSWRHEAATGRLVVHCACTRADYDIRRAGG